MSSAYNVTTKPVLPLAWCDEHAGSNLATRCLDGTAQQPPKKIHPDPKIAASYTTFLGVYGVCYSQPRWAFPLFTFALGLMIVCPSLPACSKERSSGATQYHDNNHGCFFLFFFSLVGSPRKSNQCTRLRRRSGHMRVLTPYEGFLFFCASPFLPQPPISLHASRTQLLRCVAVYSIFA